MHLSQTGSTHQCGMRLNGTSVRFCVQPRASPFAAKHFPTSSPASGCGCNSIPELTHIIFFASKNQAVEQFGRAVATCQLPGDSYVEFSRFGVARHQKALLSLQHFDRVLWLACPPHHAVERTCVKRRQGHNLLPYIPDNVRPRRGDLRSNRVTIARMGPRERHGRTSTTSRE